MSSTFGIVDLFAGPGGLGEGFASFLEDGRAPFRIGISVEKEASAHRTLTLRAFLRNYRTRHGVLPAAFVDFHAGLVSEPDWSAVDAEAWQSATGETRALELGKAVAATAIDDAIAGDVWTSSARGIRTKEDQPYLMYDAVNDSRTRPAHRALDGIIRPVDDPFWLTHSPPLGHNCRCTLIQLDAEQAEARSRNGRGLNQPETPEMRPDDDGWGRKPTRWDKTLTKLVEKKGNEWQAFNFAGRRTAPSIWCDETNYAGILRLSTEGYTKAAGAMPPPRGGAGIERLISHSPDDLFERFMREFDGPEYMDIIGNELRIDHRLFESLAGRTKILKGERAKWLVFTARNIREPDEIWREPGRNGGADKLYYLSRFDVGLRELLVCIAVFERSQDEIGQWIGRTNYVTTQRGYMKRKRNHDLTRGELKYWRWE